MPEVAKRVDSRKGRCKARPYRQTKDAVRMREAMKQRKKLYGCTYAPAERIKRGLQ